MDSGCPLRYSAVLRLIPLASCVFCAAFVACALGITRLMLLGARAHAPQVVGVQGVILCSGVLLFILAAYSMGRAARSTWSYMCGYCLEGTTLHVTSPFLRRRQAIDLSEVRVVRRLFIYGGPTRRSQRGISLAIPGGRRLILSEALPIWQQIVSMCVAADVEV